MLIKVYNEEVFFSLCVFDNYWMGFDVFNIFVLIKRVYSKYCVWDFIICYDYSK